MKSFNFGNFFIFFSLNIMVLTSGSASQPALPENSKISTTPLANTLLELKIRSDKPVYTIGSNIIISIDLINKSGNFFYIYSPIDWGESASISIWMKNIATGKNVTGDVWPDAISPPPTSIENFIKLESRKSFNKIVAIKPSIFTIDKSGEYEIIVEYHSPVPSGLNFGFPILSRDDGIVSSNSIVIKMENK